MKTIHKNLLFASLLLATSAASAQCVKLEERMSNLISEYGEELCTNKTINVMRDLTKPGRPLQSKCEIHYFTLKKKNSYQRELLEEMRRAMETEGREDPSCYAVNSMSSSENTVSNRRRLMIGDDAKDYIEIGKDYDNYLNVNVLDTSDTTNSHRYAYAVEWREKGKTIDLRYIVTYAKIPSATSSVTSMGSSFFDLGRARVNPYDRIIIKGPAHFQWNGTDYPIDKIDSIFRDAEKRGEQLSRRFRKAFRKDNVVVFWADSLNHDNDPVNDVVLRLQQGEDVTSNDLLCNDNILLVFSQLKQQYQARQNTEFNAISIYTLCKRARESGFFADKDSEEELEQLKSEVSSLIGDTPQTQEGRTYLVLALSQLNKIQ